MTKYSVDYKDLYQQLKDGREAVGLVDEIFGFSTKRMVRYLAHIKRLGNFHFTIGGRGITHGGIMPFEEHIYNMSEEEMFVKECKRLNLEWILLPKD